MTTISSDMSLAQAFEVTASDNDRKTALICGEERLTFAQVSQGAARLAYGLSRLGVKSGDRVGLMLGNSPEFVMALFAVAKLGAVAVPLDPQARGLHLEHVLHQSEPCALLVSELAVSQEALATARAMKDMLVSPQLLLGLEQGQGGPTFGQLLSEEVPDSFDFPFVNPDHLLFRRGRCTVIAH
jgi:acyl-CoA synthetase (AMP-forming)/AMP-acid ligase II